MLWFKRVVTFIAFLALVMAVHPTVAQAYAPCNCTAYAHALRPDLPMTLGDARTWGVRARRMGYSVTSRPQVGDIMVLQPGIQGASRWYGHVAYVTAVVRGRVPYWLRRAVYPRIGKYTVRRT
ncbi:MAG: hypothetical protein NVS4B8_07010 [Herpetosiphon sp.]